MSAGKDFAVAEMKKLLSVDDKVSVFLDSLDLGSLEYQMMCNHIYQGLPDRLLYPGEETEIQKDDWTNSFPSSSTWDQFEWPPSSPPP